MRAMPSRIEEDSEWFFLPKKWLEKWELYCYVDVINAASDGNAEAGASLASVTRKDPGRVGFSDLFVPKEENQITEQMLRYKWQNHQIKKGQREGVDFIFVTKEVFDAFITKYRSDETEPHLNYKRYGVEQDDGEVVCELSMRKINFVALPNKKLYKMRKPWFCYIPKSETVAELEKKIVRCINYYMSSVR